jgi:DNA repair photolyase
MARVRETQGGKDYDPEFGKRMTGQGRWAELLKQRFQLACRKHGLSRELPDLRSDLFQVPPKPGDQMSLF